MGQARDAPPPARRPALRERLSVRRHLSGPRHGRRPGAPLRRHGRDATPPRRDRPNGEARCPRRPAPRQGRLAYDACPPGAEQHHDDPLAVACPGIEPGREHLAAPAPDMALEPRLRYLRRHHRRRLRRLAEAHRSARNHHLNRLTPMGPRRSKMRAVGNYDIYLAIVIVGGVYFVTASTARLLRRNLRG